MMLKSIYRSLLSLLFMIFFASCADNNPNTTYTPESASGIDQNEETEAKMVVQFSAEQEAHIKSLIKNYQKGEADIDAERIFRERCAICHGVKGNLGVNGAGDLTKSSLNLTDRVATIYYGKKTMTPFKEILSDAEIVELALYVALLRQP